MEPVTLAGNWFGYYTYLEGYSGDWLDKKVLFQLEALVSDDGFSGTIKDDIATGGVDDGACIKGRMSGTKISFKKEYTKAHYVGRDGEQYSVAQDDPIPVTYFGRYDEAEQRFTGEWIILSSITPIGNNEFAQCSGAWEMRRTPY